jgi:Transposase
MKTNLPQMARPGDAPEELLVQVLQPYGVGIDTHSKFIAVCVMRQRAKAVVKFEAEFKTDWASLLEARKWITDTLSLRPGSPFRYCIESTGTYHFPVLLAFGGEPSVVNPLLAGPTRRKTDVLDARLLAHHSITGLWPASFIPSPEAKVLRVLWAERGEAQRNATRASTAREWAAKAASVQPVMWAGIAMMTIVAGLLAYFGWWTKAGVAVAIGVGMIVLAQTLPTHGTLILFGGLVVFALVALLVLYSYHKGQLDQNNNGIPDLLEGFFKKDVPPPDK